MSGASGASGPPPTTTTPKPEPPSATPKPAAPKPAAPKPEGPKEEPQHVKTTMQLLGYSDATFNLREESTFTIVLAKHLDTAPENVAISSVTDVAAGATGTAGVAEAAAAAAADVPSTFFVETGEDEAKKIDIKLFVKAPTLAAAGTIRTKLEAIREDPRTFLAKLQEAGLSDALGLTVGDVQQVAASADKDKARALPPNTGIAFGQRYTWEPIGDREIDAASRKVAEWITRANYRIEREIEARQEWEASQKKVLELTEAAHGEARAALEEDQSSGEDVARKLRSSEVSTMEAKDERRRLRVLRAYLEEIAKKRVEAVKNRELAIREQLLAKLARVGSARTLMKTLQAKADSYAALLTKRLKAADRDAEDAKLAEINKESQDVVIGKLQVSEKAMEVARQTKMYVDALKYKVKCAAAVLKEWQCKVKMNCTSTASDKGPEDKVDWSSPVLDQLADSMNQAVSEHANLMDEVAKLSGANNGTSADVASTTNVSTANSTISARPAAALKKTDVPEPAANVTVAVAAVSPPTAAVSAPPSAVPVAPPPAAAAVAPEGIKAAAPKAANADDAAGGAEAAKSRFKQSGAPADPVDSEEQQLERRLDELMARKQQRKAQARSAAAPSSTSPHTQVPEAVSRALKTFAQRLAKVEEQSATALKKEAAKAGQVESTLENVTKVEQADASSIMNEMHKLESAKASRLGENVAPTAPTTPPPVPAPATSGNAAAVAASNATELAIDAATKTIIARLDKLEEHAAKADSAPPALPVPQGVPQGSMSAAGSGAGSGSADDDKINQLLACLDELEDSAKKKVTRSADGRHRQQRARHPSHLGLPRPPQQDCLLRRPRPSWRR
jgi:hypothetical protein